MIEMQETQPLPPLVFSKPPDMETSQDYYQRLKAVSDATGIRLLFVYLAQQRQQLHRTRPRLSKTRWIPEGR